MNSTDHSFENTDQKPVCLMVLGPHRCGTSALSGMLNHLGMDLPATLMPASKGNAAGYFESMRVMAFNDKLLNALGSNWRDLSPIDLESIPAQVFDSLMSEAVDILEKEFSTARLPLLKDPRICRFVEFWTEAFARVGYRSLYVHTHRNPLEAADSIGKRNDIPIELGLLIWLRHVLDAEAATRGRARVFTNYGALLDNWRTQVEHIEKNLDLTFHRKTVNVRQTIDDFLSDSLHHQHRSPEEVHRSVQVADIVRDAFVILERWTGTAGNSLDHDALDALRRRLDGSLDQIDTFVRAQEKGKEVLARLSELEKTSVQLRDEKAELAAKMEDDRKSGTEKEAAHVVKTADLEGLVRQRSLEAEEWFEENGLLKHALEEAKVQQAKLENEHEKEKAGLQQNLDNQENQIHKLKKSIDERFAEIAQVSRMLLDAQSQSNSDAAEIGRLHHAIVAERAHLQKRIRDRDARILEMERTISDRSEEITQINEKLLGTSNRETQARENFEGMLSSTSWKIMGPLRWFVNLFYR